MKLFSTTSVVVRVGMLLISALVAPLVLQLQFQFQTVSGIDEHTSSTVVETTRTAGSASLRTLLIQNDEGTTGTNGGVFTKCGFSSNDNFATWYQILFTNSPVLFPQNDAELSNIVTTAQANGCKVRVRGAGHSEDGIVMQKLDELRFDVVVVNLKDYLPDDATWNENIDSTTPSVKMSAGASTLKMMSFIRPQGYLTCTCTAGRFFSLGGSFLNPSVIGSTFGASRLAAQVLSVRVMDADGTITIYSGEDVKPFRGSMGYLGIITALEIKLRVDDGLSMFRQTLSTQNFNKDTVREFFQNQLDTYDAAEWFYHVHEDAVEAFVQDFSSNQNFDPVSTQSWYDTTLAESPDLAYTGGGVSDGSSGLTELASGIVAITRSLATLLGVIGRSTNNDLYDEAAILPNDGYFLSRDIPKYEQISHTARCATDCLDEMTNLLEVTRLFLRSALDDSDSTWFPTLPYEWRIFDVQDDEMVLEHLSPGKYVLAENTALFVNNDYEYSVYYKQLEDLWRNLYPLGGIHHGKAYGYGPTSGMGDEGQEFPFQDNSIIDTVYTDAVRQNFIASMEMYDPSETFRAGSVLRMLGLTVDQYTPKQYVGDSCQTFGDGECLSGCCDSNIFDFSTDVCVASDKIINEECETDCECSESVSSDNPCRRTWLSWTKRCRA